VDVAASQLIRRPHMFFWRDTNQIQATASVIYTLLTLAYVIVTLVGFLKLKEQIKQVEISTRGEMYGDLYTHQHEITRFFIDNPNLRSFFYDGKKVSETDTELMKLRAVTEMIADFSEHVFIQLSNLPEGLRDGWEFYIKNIYRNSPVLQSHFEDEHSGRWYSEEFKKLLKSSIQETNQKAG
jgi:hypothetical protein